MNKIDELAKKHLGQNTNYDKEYNPSLLVKIPRIYNRELLGIDNNYSFYGSDVWNAYEVSFLTTTGLPINGIVKLIIASDSLYHIESKSLKLYLNSFNMTKLKYSISDSINAFIETIKSDIELLLENKISVFFSEECNYKPSPVFLEYENIMDLIKYEELDFNKKKLTVNDILDEFENCIYTNLLRSNCRVTNQPDWGNVYISYKANKSLNLKSFIQYIVAMREMNHFHEEICEDIYINLFDLLNPSELMVSCLYTRRGGIDINPIRASDKNLVPNIFNNEIFISKTSRQ